MLHRRRSLTPRAASPPSLGDRAYVASSCLCAPGLRRYSSVREREIRGPFLISFLFSSFLLLFSSSLRIFWNASAVCSTWGLRRGGGLKGNRSENQALFKNFFFFLLSCGWFHRCISAATGAVGRDATVSFCQYYGDKSVSMLLLIWRFQTTGLPGKKWCFSDAVKQNGGKWELQLPRGPRCPLFFTLHTLIQI